MIFFYLSQCKIIKNEAMKLDLFLVTFAIFVTASESIWCFRCHTGNFTDDFFGNISLAKCRNLTENTTATCSIGCMKFKIKDNNRHLTTYDCHDKNIDKKLNETAIIKKIVCYTNFCNGERYWNIPKIKTATTKNYVSEFWIYICIIILVSLIIHVFKFICRCAVEQKTGRMKNNVNSRTNLIGIGV